LGNINWRIIKKNRIGLNKSSDNGNAIKCYKRLNTEYSDNNRYIKEANLFVEGIWDAGKLIYGRVFFPNENIYEGEINLSYKFLY